MDIDFTILVARNLSLILGRLVVHFPATLGLKIFWGFWASSVNVFLQPWIDDLCE